jgi:hypothetical protein
MKKLMTVFMTVLISLLISSAAFAGTWKQDNTGWWYENDDGSYKKSEWFQNDDGNYYYFNDSGYMLTNDTTPDGCYVDENGIWVPDAQAPENTGEAAGGSGSSVSSGSAGTTGSGTASTYILNISSKKFHYPSCSSVKKMKDSNKKTFTGTREEAIQQGYTPCQICKP